MARKKTTTPLANDAGALVVACWTTEETMCLLEYLIAHHAEGGDGMGFKQATFTGASIHLQDLPPPDATVKENHVVGFSRDWQSCKNKWINMHPDVKPFHNKSWEHFHKMDKLMCMQLSCGTNSFCAGHKTFKSEQGPPDDGQANGGLEDIQPVVPVEGEAEQLGEHVEE
ncbi:hypothetical protein BDR04DRAFT_1118909 [Suillus decipiens]|nr:hypothetical protein BDR04DRAFT_1118909 [Suillus decipiens]